jgi:hypothetical protein
MTTFALAILAVLACGGPPDASRMPQNQAGPAHNESDPTETSPADPERDADVDCPPCPTGVECDNPCLYHECCKCFDPDDTEAPGADDPHAGDIDFDDPCMGP